VSIRNDDEERYDKRGIYYQGQFYKAGSTLHQLEIFFQLKRGIQTL
jgi:hypothetical protein